MPPIVAHAIEEVRRLSKEAEELRKEHRTATDALQMFRFQSRKERELCEKRLRSPKKRGSGSRLRARSRLDEIIDRDEQLCKELVAKSKELQEKLRDLERAREFDRQCANM